MMPEDKPPVWRTTLSYLLLMLGSVLLALFALHFLPLFGALRPLTEFPEPFAMPAHVFRSDLFRWVPLFVITSLLYSVSSQLLGRLAPEKAFPVALGYFSLGVLGQAIRMVLSQ